MRRAKVFCGFTLLALGWILWGQILPEGFGVIDMDHLVPDWRAIGWFDTFEACDGASTPEQQRYPTLRIDRTDEHGRRTHVESKREVRCLPEGQQPPGVVR